jgi:NAD(P)-dependent dehydrogenase (short-subunit alcohol dehydrogenase family)
LSEEDRSSFPTTSSARFAGEVALVTGSTSGLGAVIAERLASEGAQVVITGRDLQRGRERARRSGCAFVAADLSDQAGCEHLFAEVVATVGAPSILVNNAVDPHLAAHDGPVASTEVATWTAMFNIVVVAAATLCRLVIPHMVDMGRGSIVNVSSRAASRGSPGVSAYSSSKAALEALARSITADYARSGIRCNVVQPGYILHEQRDRDMDPERRARYEAMHLTRLPTAQDVAAAVAFLASREAEVITGVTLPVDGGSSAVRGSSLG